MSSVRTDLALEVAEAYERRGQRIPGVAVDREKKNGCIITRVDVLNADGEKVTGKPPGRYVTLEDPALRERDPTHHEALSGWLAEELGAMLPLEKDELVFVVGLGNQDATPDALGPAVVKQLLVTRHLQEAVPEDLRGGLRPVCALAPGVLGTTGIETSDIIRGITEQLKPDAIIAVDALAAQSIERILTTIQLANTGIQPGSGVGNQRTAISPKALGVPVVALGIPTVVGAYTIAAATFDRVLRRLQNQPMFRSIVSHWSDEAKEQLAAEVVNSTVGPLMVTPKEIDVQLRDVSRMVAGALNAFLHPDVDIQNTSRYLL